MRTNDNPPKTYLTESILVTLFCCLLFGILGIVEANRVSDLVAKGDMDGARKASEEAKTWVQTGVIVGIVISIIAYVISVVIKQ